MVELSKDVIFEPTDRGHGDIVALISSVSTAVSQLSDETIAKKLHSLALSQFLI